jgi:predicted phosphodiesterase
MLAGLAGHEISDSLFACWRMESEYLTSFAANGSFGSKLVKMGKNSSCTIVCISDTHESHEAVSVPGGDILIHAGDFTMFSRSLRAVETFNDWLGQLNFRYRIFGCGNHESFLQEDPAKRSLLSNATVLINEGIEVMGLKVWGSPVTPLSSGAFAMGDAADRTRLYALIPSDVDILITHTPPFGILDCPPGAEIHSGCPQLLDAVMRLSPKLHVFGHSHTPGMVDRNGTLFVNASMLESDGDIRHTPIVLRTNAS